MTEKWSLLKKLIWLRGVGIIAAVWTTITNVAVATFTAVSATLRELVIDVTPVQSGSGAPSPDGPNLYDAATNTDGKYINAAGGIVDNANACYSAFIAVTEGTVYRSHGVVSFDGTSTVRIHGYNANDVWQSQLAYQTLASGDSPFDFTFTVPSGVTRIRITLIKSNSGVNVVIKGNERPISGWTGANIVVSPTLDATDGTTYPVSWQTEAGTVYGGTLRDNGDGTWTLTKTHVRAQVKDFGWTRAQVSGASFYRFWIALDGKAAGLGNIICEALQMSDAAAVADMSDNSIRGASASNTVSIRADAFSTVEELTDTTTGIGNAAIVYELATPVSHALTAGSVQALIGQNNIFADCGNINTITYQER